MKKIFLITTLLVFTHLLSMAQDNECLQGIKTGTFKYLLPNGEEIMVERTKNKQIEYLDKDSKIISKTEWVSETECVLTFSKAVNAPGCLKPGDKMKLTVLSCEGDNHRVKVTSLNCGSGEITLVKIK